jgi:hypothetical protein
MKEIDQSIAFVDHVKQIESANVGKRKKMYACQFACEHQFRYCLKYCWDKSKERIVWIGLNPSRANEYNLDSTLYRVLYYSHKWGFGSFVMLNAFAQISTDPRVIDRAKGIGRRNDEIIREYLSRTSCVMCAWSNCGRNRQNELSQLIGDKTVCCLGVSKAGYPCHPSRKRNEVKRVRMRFYSNCKQNSIAMAER